MSQNLLNIDENNDHPSHIQFINTGPCQLPEPLGESSTLRLIGQIL